MKKPLIYTIVLLVLSLSFSCSKEELSIENENSLGEIIYFESNETFKNTLNLFNSFNEISEFEDWSRQQNYNSLYSDKNITLKEQEDLPLSFLFLLNEKREFQIGDRIINYSEGVFYERNLNGLNQSNKIFAKVEQSPLSTDNEDGLTDKITSNRVSINANGGEYKQGWREYNRQKYRTRCGTPYNKSLKYRLVHYLVVRKVSGPFFTQSDLIFKLRMSQKTGSGWKYNNTTTERLYDLNLSGSWYIKYKYGGNITSVKSFSINDKNYCSSPLKGTKSFWIGNYNFVSSTPISHYEWRVNLSGSIFHKVNGDTNQLNTTINW
ncbi:hypothetical protein [Dokdonia sp. Asnod2-E02]|uniref:hypothetical protein n=1 Tax=Dokdonia sp. Asnod2-E02 TaxID=3160574 RepID=UPI00386B5DF2